MLERELYATAAGNHAFENPGLPSENKSVPADKSALLGSGGAINLGKNWTLQPLISSGALLGSERDETAKRPDKVMFGASLRFSF
jgi:hypothetical protein